MKAIVFWLTTFWLAILLEYSASYWFPPASLIIPLVVGCLFFLKTRLSVLLAGAALMIRWFLNPSAPPLEIAVAIGCGTWFIQIQLERENRFATTPTVAAVPLALTTLLSLAAIAIPQLLQSSVNLALVWKYAMTSLPPLALLMAAAHLKQGLVVR